MALFKRKRSKKRQSYYGNEGGYAGGGYAYGEYRNGDYANGGYQNAGYPNGGYENVAHQNGGYPGDGYPQEGYTDERYVRRGYPYAGYPNGVPVNGGPAGNVYRSDVPPVQEGAAGRAYRGDVPPVQESRVHENPANGVHVSAGPAPDAMSHAGNGPASDAATYASDGPAPDPRSAAGCTSPYYDDAEYYRGTGRSRRDKGHRHGHSKPSVRYRRKRKAHYIDRNGREHRSLFLHDRKHAIINRIVLGMILILLIVAGVQTGLRFVAQAEQNRIQKETPVAIKSESLVQEEAARMAYAEQLEEIDLAAYANPFLGEWQARKAGSTTRTTYSYEGAGQFNYEVDAFASSRNQTGTGGYLLYDNHLITWREDEGVRAYNYEVVNNSTISVSQLVTNEYGEADLDTPYTYTRVDGSDIVPPEEDVFTASVGNWVGTWTFEYSEGVTVTFTCKADGSLSYTVSGNAEVRTGKTTGCYLIYEDRMAVWLDDMATMVYRFEVDDADTIYMTQLKKSAAGTYIDSDATFICERDAG